MGKQVEYRGLARENTRKIASIAERRSKRSIRTACEQALAIRA
jgi:hypothetical protein